MVNILKFFKNKKVIPMNSIKTIREATETLRNALLTDTDLYNAFTASIKSALYELPKESDIDDASKRIIDRIIGRDF